MSEQAQRQRSQIIMLFFAFSFGMILSNLLGQNQTEAEPKTNEVLITYKGIDKTLKDLPQDKAKEFEAMQIQADKEQRQFLSALALSWRLTEFMQQNPELSSTEAGRQFFEIEDADNEAISAFYEREKENIAKPYYEVKDEIALHLFIQRAKEARRLKLEEEMKKGDIAIFPDRDTPKRAASPDQRPPENADEV